MMKQKTNRKRLIAILLAVVMVFSTGASSPVGENGRADEENSSVAQAPESSLTSTVHEHTPDCYDSTGGLSCTQGESEEHTHDEGCYVRTRGELTCAQEEFEGHIHDDECYTLKQGELVCTEDEGEDHVHGDECYTWIRDELICTEEEIEGHIHSDECYNWEETLICEEESVSEPAETVESSDESGEVIVPSDESGEKVKPSEEPEVEQTEIMNEDPVQEDGASAAENITVTNGDGTSVSVTQWTGDLGEARKYLQAALVSFKQGYTIQDVEFYRIEGLTQGTAVVSYTDSSAGLTAPEGALVFVYDLGEDGTAAPRQCDKESEEKEGDFFRSFNWKIPEGNTESSVYAFISATPATLEELGIYVGEEQEDGIWVAYDTKYAEGESNAGVKVTVTLPKGVEAPEGYKLFIRKINEGEGFYPKDEAVRAMAGEFNDWQCYTMRWIMQDETGLHMKPLNDIGTVTVRIEYLKEETKLEGPPGARKLLIFNSATDGSLITQVSDTVESVTVGGGYYQSFTFTAADAGPYVLVSKKLEKGFIEGLKVSSIVDGSGPFDASDTPGNDSGPDNGIVRSYDTIQYDLDATLKAREAGVEEKQVNMYFELTLRKSATAAKFDVSKMLWLGENYSIEYLDEQNNVIMVMDHNGKYYLPQMDENGNILRNEHGFALADTSQSVSMNAQVSGSGNGSDSYKVASGGVVMQRLVGWTTLYAKEGENILNATRGFKMAVEVRNADHGEIFTPTFKMWLEGNEDNYGPEGTSGDKMEPAQPVEANVVDAPEVTVSAGTNFNIQLKKNTDMSYKDWFDFVTGNVVAEPDRTELTRLAKLEENHGKSNPAEFTENGVSLSDGLKSRYANYRYGRITCYGIALQLYNNTDNDPAANRAAKGLKGLSLPVDDITFDLNLYSAVKSKTDETITPDEYTAILWDYNENIPAITSYSHRYDDPGRGTVTSPNDGKGNGGRNLYWDGESRSPYAKGGAPSNYIAYHKGCYYGGDWSLMDENGTKIADINTIASPVQVTGSGEGTTYHFKVNDYDFDFDNQHFPVEDAGNSGMVSGYDTYARCFSAGCVQVLSVFPMVQKVSEAEIFLNAEVSNLELTTRAGQKLKAAEGDSSKIKHEVNTEDNIKRDQIVLYAPGNLTKGNSFNGKHDGKHPNAITEGFLGTEYWTTSYDCSAFAGDEIWIVSYGMMASGSDYRTKSMNLLQLFDSRALSIRDENGEQPAVYQDWDEQFDEPGTPTFLYAADPEYPGGYDTNKEGVLEYMNTVREEDLVYYTSLDALEKEGYTCIGVLMELRGCDLLGGKYQYMRIPVKVNGDDKDLVGKTVATVNTFRVWSWDLGDITWADGTWDNDKGKNVLEGYPKTTNSIVNDQYSGELSNGDRTSPPWYVKTEYEDGLQVKGTHAGGTLAGNSLLILSYEAQVHIGVDNKGSTGMISYNLGNGETVVDYRLQSIKTVVSDHTGQADYPPTTLTIRAVLDEGYTGAEQ